MGASPRVSALIPTYRRSGYLGEAIETALHQTYDDVEVVVVNDDPDNDDTLDVLERYESDPRVVVEHNDTKRGVSASRNRAAELASGEYLCILDDDDRWYPQKVRAQIDRFERLRDDYAVVYTGGEVRKESATGPVVNRHAPRPSRKGEIWPDILRAWEMAPHSGHMIRSEAFDAVGGFDESFDYGEDWDLSIRLAERYKFAAIDDCLTIRLYHNGNVSKRNAHSTQRRDILLKHGEAILSDPAIRRGFFSEWNRTKGYYAMQEGRRTEAVRRYLLSFVAEPDADTLARAVLAASGQTAFAGVERALQRLRR